MRFRRPMVGPSMKSQGQVTCLHLVLQSFHKVNRLLYAVLGEKKPWCCMSMSISLCASNPCSIIKLWLTPNNKEPQGNCLKGSLSKPRNASSHYTLSCFIQLATAYICPNVYYIDIHINIYILDIRYFEKFRVGHRTWFCTWHDTLCTAAN